MQLTELINQQWREEKLLGFNCLLESNGRIVIMKYCEIEIDKDIRYIYRPFCETTLASLEKYNGDIWTYFQPFTDYIKDNHGNQYCAGEGAMGNEGFIVCKDELGNFKWSIFCKDSNPFYKISITGNLLKVYSSYDLEFAIDIQNPEIITISKSYWRDE